MRFPEFEGDWEIPHFSKYIKLYRGSSPRPIVKYITSKDGVNWIKIGDTKNASNNIISKVSEKITTDGALKSRKVYKGEIILANSMSFGKTYKLGLDGCIYDGWFVLREYEGFFEQSFLHQLLNSELLQKQYLRLSAGGVVQNISSDIVYQTKLSKPNLFEQQKIATFLTKVDQKIDLLQRKKDQLTAYKKGMMQKLFSQEIRFKDEDGKGFPEWEEKQLGEIATKINSKNTDNSVSRVLTNSAINGVIDQSDYFDHDVANSENLGGYYVIGKGDFVYNPRVSVTAPVGPIKRNNLGKGVMSPLYTIFRLMSENSDFLNCFFSSSLWHKYMKQVANYGARYDRMAISSNDFLKLPIPIPHPDEQQKIADYLTALDQKIELTDKKLAQAQSFKKGLLQQMFI